MNMQLAGLHSTSGVKNTEFLLNDSEIERFWSKVSKSDECWEWTGSRSNQGYGRFGVKRIPQQAHRISYEIAFGPFDAKLCICHKCDNPPLFLGSHQENTRDAIRKGRMDFSWTRKLSESDIKKIRELIERGSIPLDIANAFLVTRECIMKIISGRNWSKI